MQFQVLLFNTIYSIEHYSFICTRLNGSRYYYDIQISLICLHIL